MKKIVFSLLAACMLLGVVACGGGEKTLEQALKTGGQDGVTIKSLIGENYQTIDMQNFEGNNALTLALNGGYIDIAKALIREGADVNAKNGLGNTMLIHAMVNTEIAKMLVENGADLNGYNNTSGLTALMVAAYSGNVELAKIFIEKGADVNLVDYQGNTALSYAIDEEYSEIEELLRVAGAYDFYAEMARAREGEGLGDDYDDEYDFDDGGDGESLTFVLYQQGDWDAVKSRINNQGVSANVGGRSGTLLTIASARGNMEHIQFLLSKGADVNAKGGIMQITALMNASTVEVAKFLIEKGANVNLQDSDGMTALGYATEDGNTAVMEVLKAAGAKLASEL